jgi:ferric-chelate reductase
MGVLSDVLQKHASGKSRLRVIEVIWAVTDPGEGLLLKIIGALTGVVTN